MTDDKLEYDFEFRSLDEAGHFTGMASAYGVKDSYESIFDPGSLVPQQLPLPFTYQHDWNQLLGGITVFENRSEGAYIEGDFDLSVSRAKEIYSLAKKGIIKGLSHRFSESKNEYRDGVRHITHGVVSEITLTPIPSNKQAGIQSLRTEEQEHYDDYADGNLLYENETRSWDAGAARAAWRRAATGKDGKVNLSIYGRGFLVKGSMMSEFKFPIGMPDSSGNLKVSCDAVHAAETRVEGANVSDKSGLKSRIESLAKKCGFRDESDDSKKPDAKASDSSDSRSEAEEENEESELYDKILKELEERTQELNALKDSLGI